MEFCPNCDNMMYTRLNSEEGESLTLYCQRCGTTKSSDSTTGPVSSTLIKQQLQKPAYVAGTATAQDPTLPIAKDIACPVCAEAGRPAAPVVYVRYDTSIVKYLYICTACPHRWNVQNLTN